jgi:hypothetical protein
MPPRTPGERALTWRASQDAHAALYNAVPKTLQDVVVVLRHVIGGMAASDDSLAAELIPRLRRLRAKLGRKDGAVTLDSLVELRCIASASTAVSDGGGKITWIAQWLNECAVCLGRPR